jgi:small subunit ribosomal protein S21
LADNEHKSKGTTVHVRHDNVEQALRKFRKKIMTSGLLQEVRDREFYEKPTALRKRKKGAAKNRWKKKLENELLPKRLF